MQSFSFLVRFKDANLSKALDNTARIAFNLSIYPPSGGVCDFSEKLTLKLSSKHRRFKIHDFGLAH